MDVEGVEPESEDTGFTLALSIKVLNLRLLFLGDRLKAGVGVEEVGDEGEIELGVAGNERFGSEELAALEFVGVVKDLLGALEEVAGLEGSAGADVGGELVEEDGIVFGVGDVLAEVVHRAVPFGGLEMVVEPPEENLLWGETEELLEGLAVFKEPVELGVELDINLAQKSAPDNLPDETENQVLTALNDIAGANIDDGTADGLCGIDDNVVVFGHVEVVELLGAGGGTIEDTLVDRVGDGIVDELCEDEAIFALVKHLQRSAAVQSLGYVQRTWKVSVSKGRRSPMSLSPARTALMCLVNSVRSSSLMVCVEAEVCPPMRIWP